MSLLWHKEIQQVPIKKSFGLPLRWNITEAWATDSLPKRNALLEELTQTRERMLISRIAVYVKTDDGKIYFKVVVLKDFFNLANEDHLKKFKQILLSINLENIYFIDSEYSDYLRQTSTTFANLRNMSAKKVSNSDNEIHIIRKCEHNDMDKIISHLNGTSKDDVTDDEMEKVDSFIEHGFYLYPELLSYVELLETHNRTKEWFRKEKPIIDDETFLEIVENCRETLDQQYDNVNVLQHWYMVAHALLECKKTKEAQQVKDPYEKKKKAFSEWKKNYQGKTKKERKVSGTSLRSIAKKVGISVGTLSNWIKEFKKIDEKAKQT